MAEHFLKFRDGSRHESDFWRFSKRASLVLKNAVLMMDSTSCPERRSFTMTRLSDRIIMSPRRKRMPLLFFVLASSNLSVSLSSDDFVIAEESRL